MAAYSWTKPTKAIFICQAMFLLLAMAGTAQAQQSLQPYTNQNLSTTSNADDYAIQNQRQYAAYILSMNAQLDEYKARYQQQLSTIDFQTAMLEDRLREIEQKLNPLELLDELSKHCVQKYRVQIATVAWVKATMGSCVTAASGALPGYLTAPATTVVNLQNYYNNQLKATLAECQRNNPNSQLNYTLCVTKVIASANTVTNSNMKTFATQLELTKCSGDARIKQALDCGFTTFYSTTSMVGETNRLIDNCIAGKEFCPPCVAPPPPPAPVTQSKCKHAMELDWVDSDFRNATIENPFYGLNVTDCVTVNFGPLLL